MKIRFIIFLFLFSFISSAFSANVTLAWDASCDLNVIGYRIYYGSSSNSLTPQYGPIVTYNCPSNIISYTNIVYGTDFKNTVDAGNTTSITITNLNPGMYYYFAATSYDGQGNESDFSNQSIYYATDATNVIKYTYLGMKIDYGTNIFNLNSKSVMMTQKDSSIPYFYRSSLLITNRPIIGTRPNDGNSYVYLGGVLQYGTNLFQLTTESYDLMTLTNPPSYFYRGSLIITNRAF